MNSDAVRLRLQEERERVLYVRDAASRLHTEVANSDGDTLTPDALTSEKATETIGRELDESVASHAEVELEEIEAALARLDAGTYGFCQECGLPISDDRLEILPATRHCVDDQAKLQRHR